MERDGITKVFVTNGVDTARKMFPGNHSDELERKEVAHLLGRADFTAYNREIFQPGPNDSWGSLVRSEWIVTFNSGKQEFIVDRMRWAPEERYSKLAEILEEISGNKGLTILVR